MWKVNIKQEVTEMFRRLCPAESWTLALVSMLLQILPVSFPVPAEKAKQETVLQPDAANIMSHSGAGMTGS